MPTESLQSGIDIGTAIVSVLSVIIGGLLTAVGGFIGAYVAHKLGRTSAQETLRREKLEALVKLAHQTMHWLDSYKNEYILDGEKLTIPCPIGELEMISDLYFPELNVQKFRVSLACVAYQKWVITGVQEKSQTGKISQEFKAEYSQIYKELLESVSALSKEAGEIMKELNRS